MNRASILGFAVGPVGAALLGFVSLPAVAWFYAPEDIGRIALLQVAISFSILFFSLGLDQAYVREYHESTDKSSLLRAVMKPGLLLLSLVVSFLLFIPRNLSDFLYDSDAVLPGLLTLIGIVAGFFIRFLSLVLRMKERGMAFSVSQILPKFLFVLAVLMLAVFSESHTFSELLGAHVVSMMAVALYLAWITRREWRAKSRVPFSSARQREMLRFGTPLIISGVAFWVMTSADRLFIRHYSTFSELGAYSLAASFAGAAIILQSVFSVVWAPTVYRWVAEGDGLERADKVTEHVLSAVIFIFILAGLFSGVVNWLLPDSYHSVQYLFVGCMAYPLFYTLSETTVVGLGVARRSDLVMVATLVAVAVCIAANMLLVKRFGSAGAATATALAFWVFLVCRTELSSRVWRPLPRKKLYISSFLILVIVSLYVIWGHEMAHVFTYIWLGALLISAVSFRSSLVAAVQFSSDVLSGKRS